MGFLQARDFVRQIGCKIQFPTYVIVSPSTKFSSNPFNSLEVKHAVVHALAVTGLCSFDAGYAKNAWQQGIGWGAEGAVCCTQK